MEPQVPVILLLGLVALGFFGLGARRSWRRRAVLTGAPRASLSELRPGFYRGTGRIKSSAESFVTPLSEKPCVYYELLVEEKVGSGRDAYWRTVVHDEKSCRVEIEDGTGHAHVELPAAELRLVLDRHVSTGLLSSAPAVVEQRLQAKYGESTKGRVFSKKMRLAETFLELGDELQVIGQVAWDEGGPSFQDAGPAFIVSDRDLHHVIRRESWVFLAWVSAGVLTTGLLALMLITLST